MDSARHGGRTGTWRTSEVLVQVLQTDNYLSAFHRGTTRTSGGLLLLKLFASYSSDPTKTCFLSGTGSVGQKPELYGENPETYTESGSGSDFDPNWYQLSDKCSGRLFVSRA